TKRSQACSSPAAHRRASSRSTPCDALTLRPAFLCGSLSPRPRLLLLPDTVPPCAGGDFLGKADFAANVGHRPSGERGQALGLLIAPCTQAGAIGRRRRA